MNEKDQEAINHIVSVSKHPHAEIICKWLIEPKPAYRVYADEDGDLFVAERTVCGGICQTFTDNITWLSDWIEYDHPKKWPTPLVERIAAIDIKAAEWIVEHWDELLAGKYTKGGGDATSYNLINMFNWSMTPQGSTYWNHIDNKLCEVIA
jgi:hypothetical protein